MKRLLTYIAVFCLACPSLRAQDPHFSQFGNLPMYLNPAHAGNAIEHLRMTLVYRNQWPGLASPYTTQGFLVDKKVSRFGFGMQVFRSGAGQASIQRLDLSGVIGYHMPVGRHSTVSGAMQMGMINKKFDPQNLSFDNQYVEDAGFDPALPNGEVFANTSITRPDLSFGLMFQHGYGSGKINFKPFGGIAASHVNRPDEVFISGDNRMPVRYTAHVGAGIVLRENVELRPLAVVMLQDHFNEIYAGSMISFMTNDGNKFQTGLYMRNRDAGIAYAGYQVNQVFIGTSYDFTISALNEVNKGHGGFEVTLSYIPKKRHKGRPTDPAEIIVKKPVKKEKIARIEKKDTPVQPLVLNMPESIEPASRIPERKAVTPPVPEPQVQPVAVAAPPKPQPKPAPPSTPEQNLNKAKTTRASQVENNTNAPELISTPNERSLVEQMAHSEFKAAPGPVTSMERKDQAGITAHRQEPVMKTKPVLAQTRAHIDATPVVKSLVDSDGDGIYDSEDACPYIKGGKKTRGCPDTDGDGIVDMKDLCPMEPGTPANYGCPETEPAYASTNLIRNFNNIEFETGRAVLKTLDIYDIIEYAIDIMYAHPEARIILTGHTDSEGDELFNMNLSSRRSDVVKHYLEIQGINPERIQIVSYGETMPLMNNFSDYGRARNRRVEINIVRN